MSMRRTIARNIARERLKDAGYERVNRRMSMSTGGRRRLKLARKIMSGRKRRWYIQYRLHMDPPVWRRVFDGDLEKEAVKAWKKASLRRELANQARKVHRGEAWNRLKNA